MKIIIGNNEQTIEARKATIIVGDSEFTITINIFNEMVVNKANFSDDGESSLIIKASVSNEIRIY